MSRDFAALRAMSYPGRVIVIGGSPKGERAILVYAVTGRSPASQSRRLRLEGRSVWTEPLDEETIKKGNVELLIYRTLAIDSAIAVSNGRQTEDIVRGLNETGKNEDPERVLSQALQGWSYEPDAPHYTPRISGCVLRGGRAALGLITRGADGAPQRTVFSWTIAPGKGKMIATYNGGEENPLLSFSGPPHDLETREPAAKAMAEAAFEAMAPRDPAKDYRVSVACVYASLFDLASFDSYIINHRERQDRHG